MAKKQGITLFGFRKIRAKYKKLMRKLDPKSPESLIAYKQIMVYMHSSIAKNFNSQGRPKAWKQLAQSTIDARRKGKGKGSAKILMDTGRLRQSVTQMPQVNRLAVMKRDRRGFSFGTKLKYAAAHNFGKKKTVTENVSAHQRRTRTASGRWSRKKIQVGSFSRKRKMNIPKREFMLFQKADETAINRILRRIVKKFDEKNRVKAKG
ncbi:phage virion morphogenesis protein [bacterium]|nr:phage virion morphogenesis protein [bacterium]